VVNRDCHLSVPVELKPQRLLATDRVCAVDVGINTRATASIASSSGTVAARRFFHPAADIDCRNKLGTLIRRKARQTAKLSKCFCRSLHRKARHINEQIAQLTSKQLVAFALVNGASVIVLDQLKGRRPSPVASGTTATSMPTTTSRPATGHGDSN
jgi:transposase